MTDTGEILTVAEVAKLLKVGRNAVYDAAARNQIPHVRVGRLLRFSRSALLAWLSADARATVPPWSLQVAEEG